MIQNTPAQGSRTLGLLALAHPVVRLGLADALARAQPGWSLLHAETMAEVEGKLAAADIDLLVICFRLPGLGGAWGLRRLRALRPAMRVLVLSPVENPATFAACRAAGVDGYIAMGSPIEQVLQAIAAVRSGGSHVPPDTPALPPADAAPRLTARQLQVLRLVAEGLGTREIAQRLGLGLGTVKRHLAAAYARLGARSRLQAIVKAGLSGPADPDDKAG